MEAMAQLSIDDRAALAEQFIDYIDGSVTRLVELAVDLPPLASPPEEVSDEIYGIAHNIKGMGSTFGYDLLTEISSILCEYGRNVAECGVSNSQVINNHISAIRLVVEHRICGDGGAKGRELINGLNETIAANL